MAKHNEILMERFHEIMAQGGAGMPPGVPLLPLGMGAGTGALHFPPGIPIDGPGHLPMGRVGRGGGRGFFRGGRGGRF